MKSKNKPRQTRHEFEHAAEWRSIPGYEGLYEVNAAGEIRSLSKAWKSRYSFNLFPGRVLRPAKKANGYLVVSLSKENKPKQVLVHRIVLLAFVGECPDGHEACHNNGIRSDNRAANLRWGTRSENHKDKHLHGTAQIGKKANNVKLTEAIVLAMRKEKLRPIDAVQKFGLSRTNAARVVRGDTWRHISA